MPITAEASPLEPSRRRFLLEAGGGFGAVALTAMLANDRQSAAAPTTSSPTMPRPPHVVPRATRVIYLFMHGGPSQVDLFDPKPELIRQAGKPLPDEFGKVMTRRKVVPIRCSVLSNRFANMVSRVWRSATSSPRSLAMRTNCACCEAVTATA